MLLSLTLLLAACATPEPTGLQDDSVLPCDVDASYARIALQRGEALAIDWGDSEVWAIAVTSPGARIGAMGKLESGTLYWQVAATDFGVPLTGPVTVGQVPEGATDYTSFAGGVYEELEPGRCYEVQVSDPAHELFGRLQFRP